VFRNVVCSTVQPGKEILDCFLHCIFSLRGPYQVCSAMLSAQFSSRAWSFRLYSISYMLFGCPHHVGSRMSSPQMPSRARRFFGLYSMFYIFFGWPVQRVFRNVVCSSIHPGEEFFGLYILYYICSLVVLTTCAQECCLLKCPPGRGVSWIGLYSMLYIFFG
jgi:hypothetical protein